ncbi:MAG: FprA family A-type flavoprotein, partial [Oscillospiraceae bacterium]|nr:FprA family A-type flavoprotein [Oscillospiraceae bacterium]
MINYRKISDDLFYIGASDRRLALFENVYPIPAGVSYNSYVLLDEKTVLFDTVDRSVSEIFFENLSAVLNGRSLDYAVVSHVEPDHAGTLAQLVLSYPDVTLVVNEQSLEMIQNFNRFENNVKTIVVSSGETLKTGRHSFVFVAAHMVHWPEVMVVYDTVSKTLFSADAFGTFGALNGAIFADEVDFETKYLDDARRYYCGIVGKYGTQVNAILDVADTLEIETLCPLHGPVWRKDIAWFVEKYRLWANYAPEEQAVLIVYGSIYGHTQNAAEILASKLNGRGLKTELYDVSVTDVSVLLAEAFRYSHLVFASATYNAGIFSPMENLLRDIAAHELQNRTVALIENGSWAPQSGELMRGILSELAGFTILDDTLSLKSSLKLEQLDELDKLADAIADSFPKPAEAAQTPANTAINPGAF